MTLAAPRPHSRTQRVATRAEAALRVTEWRLALVTAVLTAVGNVAFIVVDAHGVGLRPLEAAARSAHAIAGALVAGVLWLGRDRITREATLAVTALLLAAFLPTLWLSETTSAASGRPWSPFVGHKLVMACAALVLPGPPWFGGVVLAALGLEQVVLWRHLGLGAPGSMVSVDEPWASIAYFAVVAVAFGYRVFHARVECEREREHARAEALEANARASLAARDLANTPLQSLEIAVALLERRPPDGTLLERMRRSLARLRSVNDVLAPGEDEPGDEPGV